MVSIRKLGKWACRADWERMHRVHRVRCRGEKKMPSPGQEVKSRFMSAGSYSVFVESTQPACFRDLSGGECYGKLP